MEVLNLGGNALSGPIPAELGNLSALEHLNLVGNRLSGAIPVAFGSLTGLESLDLAWNALSGSIPAGLGNLTNLKSLDLAGNELGGSIPDALWNLTDLVVLDLHGNALSGPIPVALGELARLERVYFSSNRLSGPFPAVVARLPELERMEFESNQWSGPLPGDVWKLANLEVLHSRRGQLRDATDVGTVRFAGEAGQLVAVTARSHGSAAQLRLRSSAGERIALAGPYGDEFQLARLPSDGEYRIDVLTRRGFGDYEVTVRAVPLEPLTMGSSVDTFLAAGLGVRAWRFRGRGWSIRQRRCADRISHADGGSRSVSAVS